MTKVVVCAAIVLIILAMAWYQTVMRNAEAAVEEMMGTGPEGCVPKLEQVRVLEELGIRVVPENKKRELLLEFGYQENEYLASHPYYGFLIMAGGRGILNCVYSTGDWECIYQDDAYGKILEKMKRISSLPIEQIEGRDRYEVRFEFSGFPHSWRARRNRDWMDCGLGGYVNRVLDRQKVGEKARFYLDTSHGAPIFLFGEEMMVSKLNSRTGLRFHLAKSCHEREGWVI